APAPRGSLGARLSLACGLLRVERIERVVPEPLNLLLLQIHVRIARPIGRGRGRRLGDMRNMMMADVLGGVGGAGHRSGEPQRNKCCRGLHFPSSHSFGASPRPRVVHECPVPGYYVAPHYWNLMYPPRGGQTKALIRYALFSVLLAVS